jgi:hypothetical protein
VDPAAYLDGALSLQLDALGYDVVWDRAGARRPPGTSAEWYRARCTTSSTTRSTTSRHVSARRSGRARAAHEAWLAA